MTLPFLFLALIVAANAAPVVIPPSSLPAKGVPYVGPQNPNKIGATWSINHQSLIPGINAALVPGSDDVLLYLGRPSGAVYSTPEGLAGVADFAKKTYHNISVNSNPFCSSIVPLTSGKLIVPGGSGQTVNKVPDGKNDIRLFDYQNAPDKLTLLTDMWGNRWYPTPTLLPDGRVMIHGGTTRTNELGVTPPFFEIWDPTKPTVMPEKFPLEKVYFEKTVQNFYPFNYVLPTGDVWNQLNDQIRFIKPDGSYRMDPANPKMYLTAPGFPADVLTQYPRSGTSAMLPLRPDKNGEYTQVDIIVSGGLPKSNKCRFGAPDAFSLAVRDLYRIRIQWTKNGDDWTYQIGNWVKEDTGIARSGGDSTLLPNGDVVFTSGGQTGCPGGTENGIRRNNYPAFWPVLYQPDRPKGSRMTVLPASSQARMYHNTAVLTRDGNIAIAGCDSCASGRPATATTNATGLYAGGAARVSFWSPSKFGRHELRDEIFSLPYAKDKKEMPALWRIKGNGINNGIVDVKYGEEVPIVWGNKDVNRVGLVPVTDVVLVAPSACTHGFNNNQRVISLVKSNYNGPAGTMTVRMPPNADVAPPQMYLMFIMNGKTYGRSRWVYLQ